MYNRPNGLAKAKLIPIRNLITISFLISILAVSCNKYTRVNWLDHWNPVPFKSNPTDNQAIQGEIKRIRVYVRGWLADYNDSARKNYKIKEFKANMTSTNPLKFTFEAYLKPPAKSSGQHDPGGHLVPPEPPDPGGFQ